MKRYRTLDIEDLFSYIEMLSPEAPCSYGSCRCPYEKKNICTLSSQDCCSCEEAIINWLTEDI